MRYIDLQKPHGYLIWKGKQKAIVSPELLPAGEKMLVIQESKEAFGEVVLSAPAQINLTEFERLEEEHNTRQEERKVKWPGLDAFYIYRFKEWDAYLDSKDVEIENGQATVLPEIKLSKDERELLEKAERLPKTLILKDEAVILEDGKAIFCDGLDGSKIMPILSAHFEDKEISEVLPLYQLALVRIPKLKLKKNMQEAIMDDETTANGAPIAVFESEKELSLDQEVSAIRDAFYNQFDRGNGAVKQSSSYWIREVYKDYVIISGDGEKFFKSTYSKDEDDNIKFADKSKWIEVEMSYSPTGNVGAKGELEQAILEGLKSLLGEKDYNGQSLEGKARQIRDAFYEAFNPKPVGQPVYKSMPWIKEVYDDYVCIGYDGKLYKANYATDENGKIKFIDKSKWVELEVRLVPTGNVGAKGIMEGYQEDAKSFSEWLDDYYELSDKSATELTEEEAIKAVWSTAFVNNLPNSSFLYIKPGCGENDEDGKTEPRSCRMFPVKDASGTVDLPHLRNAIARAPQASTIPEADRNKIQKRAQTMLAAQNKEFDEDEKAGKKIQKNMMDKLKSAWETLKELMEWAEPMEEMDKGDDETYIGIKKVGDEEWYVTYSTNAFKDREKEIFSTKSLEKYVSEAVKKEDKGYFNLWHIPETDFAEKKWQGVAGRFLVETGPFLKDAKGKAALKFFKKYSKGHPELAPEGWGCSPEYKYLPEERKKGVYENIWITRTSTLPKMAAANIHTLGGNVMALTKEQEKALKEIFGEDEAKSIISVAETKTKDLEDAGVDHKGVKEGEKQEEETKEEKTDNKDIQVPEGFAAEVAKQFDIQWQSIGAVLQDISEKQKSFETEILSLKTELAGKTSEEVKKAKDESPKYVFSLVERASEATKTIVPDEDPLKDKKPVEAAKSNGDNSGAAAFFGGK